MLRLVKEVAFGKLSCKGKPILMTDSSKRLDYVRKARRYCRAVFMEIKSLPEYRHAHESHAAARAMEITEEKFPDLGTFGVEGDCAMNGEGHIDISYLNTGETYETTILFRHGRFMVGSWGDLVEHIERREGC